MTSAPFSRVPPSKKHWHRLPITEMLSFHQVRSLDSSALKSNELERLAYPNAERGGCFKLGAARYVFFSLAAWRMTSNFQHHKLQCEAAGYVRPSVANLWTIKGVSALSGCVNGQGAWFLTPTHIASAKDFSFALLTCAQCSQQRRSTGRTFPHMRINHYLLLWNGVRWFSLCKCYVCTT